MFRSESRHRRQWTALILLVFFGIGARAQSSASGVSSASGDALQRSAKKPPVQGSLRYEYTQYTTSLSDRPELNQSQLLQAGLQGDLETAVTSTHLDLTAGRYMDIHNSYFSVQQLYIASPKHGPLEMTLGRRLEKWSEADDDWALGLWQPIDQNVDRVRPQTQGLFGLFGNYRAGDWDFLAYGSPIFIPTTTPDVSEKNGDVVAQTRWGSSQAQSGDVLQQRTRFTYKLSIPEIRRLITHGGGGARLRYGGRSPGAFVSTSYAYKPINLLIYKVDYNLILESRKTAEIEVVPEVGYHHLYGADAGWLFDKGRVSVSVLRDEPDRNKPMNDTDANGVSTDWVRQNPGRLSIYTAHGGTQMDVAGFVEPVGLDLDYMKAEEEETRDWDARGEDRGALISPYRLDFTNAASARVTFGGRWRAKPLRTSLRYLRDFEQSGTLFSLVEEYQPEADWVLRAGVDIIGVDDDSDTNTSQRFLNTFRANDRIYGGLSYVF